MGSRTLRIALLLIQALWLNVVVPGHRRGVVALAGHSCELCADQDAGATPAPCCRTKAKAPGAAHGSSSPLPADPARHCAICYFAAHLSVPDAINLTLPPLGFHSAARAQPPQCVKRIRVCQTYDGRAPPTHLSEASHV